MKRPKEVTGFKRVIEKLERKIKFQHPSHFDEFKYYQKEMFPDDRRTENDLRRDYFRMAFKVEIRQNSEYSFLTYDEIDEVSQKIDLKV